MTVPRPPIISRADWGARAPKSAYADVSYSGWSYHHTAVPGVERDLAGDIDWCQQIQNYHMDANGWNDIAGNFEISRAGRIFEARPFDVAPSIVYQHSDVGGVEHEGYFHPDVNEVPADYPKQWNASVWLDAWVCDRYGWDPGAHVLGHRQYSGNSTACPGDLWIAGRDSYITAVRAVMSAGPAPAPIPDDEDEAMPMFYDSDAPKTEHFISEHGGPGEYPHLWCNVYNPDPGKAANVTVRCKASDGKSETYTNTIPVGSLATAGWDLGGKPAVPGGIEVRSNVAVKVSLRGTK